MSPHVDGTILVARGGRTPRKTVKRAADNLKQVGAKLLGVLVNGVDMERVGYGYTVTTATPAPTSIGIAVGTTIPPRGLPRIDLSCRARQVTESGWGQRFR